MELYRALTTHFHLYFNSLPPPSFGQNFRFKNIRVINFIDRIKNEVEFCFLRREQNGLGSTLSLQVFDKKNSKLPMRYCFELAI